jgi:hypothetical protein
MFFRRLRRRVIFAIPPLQESAKRGEIRKSSVSWLYGNRENMRIDVPPHFLTSAAATGFLIFQPPPPCHPYPSFPPPPYSPPRPEF